MTAIEPTTFAQTDPFQPGRVSVTIQGTTKRLPATRDETGEIVVGIPARFVDSRPPFPAFRRLTVRLLPSGEEIAYPEDLRGTDERTYVGFSHVCWSPDAARLPRADGSE